MPSHIKDGKYTEDYKLEQTEQFMRDTADTDYEDYYWDGETLEVYTEDGTEEYTWEDIEEANGLTPEKDLKKEKYLENHSHDSSMNKNGKGKGWHGERMRHRDAAMGRKK